MQIKYISYIWLLKSQITLLTSDSWTFIKYKEYTSPNMVITQINRILIKILREWLSQLSFFSNEDKWFDLILDILNPTRSDQFEVLNLLSSCADAVSVFHCVSLYFSHSSLYWWSILLRVGLRMYREQLHPVIANPSRGVSRFVFVAIILYSK